jgi:hypothetical protein
VFITIITKAEHEKPVKIPVISRSVLLLSLNPRYCVIESIRRGILNNIINRIGILIIPK